MNNGNGLLFFSFLFFKEERMFAKFSLFIFISPVSPNVSPVKPNRIETDRNNRPQLCGLAKEMKVTSERIQGKECGCSWVLVFPVRG